jgi:type I restriction enzyme S subunit
MSGAFQAIPGAVDGWRTRNLQELGRIVTGRTPQTANGSSFGDDVLFVTPSDMDGRRFIDRTERKLSHKGFKAVERVALEANAVLVSCIGSDMGKAALASTRCVTNQQINALIVESGDDPLFVYYNLSMRKQEIHGMAGGSAQPILNKSAFGRLEIELPPQKEQRAIARIIGALDDKIELNRRMNRTLEALAQKLFKSWFVDFDPVIAKSQNRKPFGLSDELAALFPDAFVDSDLGPIPKGWRITPFSDLLDIERRLIDPQETPTEEFDHYSIPAFDNAQSPTRELGLDIKSGKYVVLGDVVLLSKLNPETPRVWWPDSNLARRAIASTEFLICRARPSANRIWLYWQWRDTDFLDELATRVTGTSNSHQRVRPDDLLRLARVDAGSQLRAKFAEVMGSVTMRGLENVRQSRTLAALRDLLLPKLFSGEIRVPVAEQAVEAALSRI